MKSIDRSIPSCGYVEPRPVMQRITDQAPSIRCAVGRYTANAWVIEPASPEDVTELAMLNHGWQSSAAAMVPLANELTRNNPSLAVVIPHQPRIPLPRKIAEIYPYIQEVGRTEVSELWINTALKVGEVACQRYGVNSLSSVGHSFGHNTQVQMAARAEAFTVDKLTACMGAGLSTTEETAGMLKRIAHTNWRKIHLKAPQVMIEGFIAATSSVLPTMKSLRESGVDIVGLDAKNDALFPPSERRKAAFPNAYGVLTEGHACHQAISHLTDAPFVAKALFEVWDKAKLAQQDSYGAGRAEAFVPRQAYSSYDDGVLYA